jgi:hypothetical protein
MCFEVSLFAATSWLTAVRTNSRQKARSGVDPAGCVAGHAELPGAWKTVMKKRAKTHFDFAAGELVTVLITNPQSV